MFFRTSLFFELFPGSDVLSPQTTTIMKLLLGCAIRFLAFTTTAQTDIIEYRSHAGLMNSFNTCSIKSIDGITTNFGMAPIRTITTAALDTVKFLKDSKAIMVTSEYC